MLKIAALQQHPVPFVYFDRMFDLVSPFLNASDSCKLSNMTADTCEMYTGLYLALHSMTTPKHNTDTRTESRVMNQVCGTDICNVLSKS